MIRCKQAIQDLKNKRKIKIMVNKVNYLIKDLFIGEMVNLNLYSNCQVSLKSGHDTDGKL